MQSCDICRKRKVKCDRRTPCARCRRLRQNCTYTDILRKKGPKFVHSYPSIYTGASVQSGTSAAAAAASHASLTGSLSGSLSGSGSGSGSSSSLPGLAMAMTGSMTGSSETLPLPIPVPRLMGGDMGIDMMGMGGFVGAHAHAHASADASMHGMVESGSGTGTGTASEGDEELDLDLDFDFEEISQAQEQQVQFQRVVDPGTRMGVGLGVASGSSSRMDMDVEMAVDMDESVSLYIKRLHPLMPVIDLREIRRLLRFGEGSRSQRYGYGYDLTQYALVCSLCAATHAHLISSASRSLDSSPARNGHLGHEQACQRYLQSALQARAQSDYPLVNIDSQQAEYRNDRDKPISRDKILTSFFLFTAYWNLHQERHAWWYLRECIALLLSARLHREDEYRKIEMYEAERRRLVFWGVFVAERTFCLVHNKPITLRPWIALPGLPSPLEEEERIDAIPSFVGLVTLFVGLAVDLTGCWTAAGFVTPISLDLGPNVATTTAATAPTSGAMAHGQDYDDMGVGKETGVGMSMQRLNHAITREWLRAKVWKLGIPGPQQASPPREFVAFTGKGNGQGQWRLEEPVLIGEAILGDLRRAGAEDVLRDHWSGTLDQKLCDICECLCDIRPVMQTRAVGAGDVKVDVDQVLRGLLRVLARLGGRSAYLLASSVGD
ncbi:Zn(II)2Cys6 transcription factor [Aspergillus mulundensis]|uniref:Zn(2)-C6 fungal-type domain-containing protein n=1 Tax=Aspergillus mulundensis TaxID=1810919 RepID=A0A3D8RZ07_9EURO|nr:hypothetical protein DSM5745_06117 [Aspergillus mulundensis]RDW79265.1 hypothetical protein DSM5745_06117 [Aspergillus mulundensis]